MQMKNHQVICAALSRGRYPLQTLQDFPIECPELSYLLKGILSK